ncbi:hypothetical protein GCM10027176_50350 [Actinoallomurus bryophytorum]
MFAEFKSGGSIADIPESGDGLTCVFALGCEHLIKAGRRLLACHVVFTERTGSFTGPTGAVRREAVWSGSVRGVGAPRIDPGISGRGRPEPRVRDPFRLTRKSYE